LATKKVLHNWADIQEGFTDCLLLGNGSSIAIYPQFAYQSLYEEAMKRKIISKDSLRVFDGFKIKDFEKVLDLVSGAREVNSILLIQDDKTDAVYKSVQNGLISIVQAIHPDQKNVVDKLKKAAKFSRQFSTVLSLNYDLIFYWMMTLANEENPKVKFKDCFSNADNTFRNDWEELRNPYNGEERTILCFYPHGNLSLVTSTSSRIEAKVVVRNSRKYLLNKIVEKWKTGNYEPLYVSEGISEQKLASIRKSTYLREVYNSVLPDVGNTLVVYGASLQGNDYHIYEALLRGSISKIAVSMFRPQDFDVECNEIEHKLRKYNYGKPIETLFFDAESKGAWIY
jgi:hypothetical protein